MAGTDDRKALDPEQDRRYTLIRLSQLYEQRSIVADKIEEAKRGFALRNPGNVIE